MKKKLEENGVIEVEAVPRDVGRPRHRLLLDDELAELETMDAVIEEADRRIG